MRIMLHPNSFPPLKTEKSTSQHLKKLSIYSQMVCLEQISSPLCNVQLHPTNRSAKRRLDDSCLDETCETPLKKPCLYKSCSPDQGCVVDSLDFSPGVQGSTPALIVSKDVTPLMSTPVSQCTISRTVEAREGLPSPIPFLNWDGDDQSFEDSLPLQVQVKSKVVVPETTKTLIWLTVAEPDRNINKRACIPVQRPAGFYNEENWHRARRTYVESVIRHMEDRESNGVLTELDALMNTVAGQHHRRPSRRHEEQWQHPSDLTQRNYLVRGPLLSLNEWQKRNHLHLRRFDKVPDIFHRSLVL